MGSGGPTRRSDSLADVVEMLLDKGVVINADIAVTIGETELLGIQLRAAIASFETAAQYGLEFPEGTDMERVREVSGRSAHLEPLDAASGGDEDGDEGEGEDDRDRAEIAVAAPVDGPTVTDPEVDEDADPEVDEDDGSEAADGDGSGVEDAESDSGEGGGSDSADETSEASEEGEVSEEGDDDDD
ncbi:gas vesicle protein GvpJ [Halegenticoccus soli]|uniref:gas vesicle protein GvpJ n=1 Tax=Halegenticoccus soli TaxID=1985678 RepID=UPI000C6CD8F0